MTRLFAEFLANIIALLTRLVTAVQARWIGCGPDPGKRVYFANHATHGDFVLIWTLLPEGIREATRPVAGADYWLKGRLRRFIGQHVFNAVFVDRDRTNKDDNPIETMSAALGDGASLIIFPEAPATRQANGCCRSSPAFFISPSRTARSNSCRCGSPISTGFCPKGRCCRSRCCARCRSGRRSS